MTIKHLLEGAMQYTKTRNHHRFAILTGLDDATVSRMGQGKYSGIRIETLDQIQQATGAPIETLMAWYRLPDGTPLGRIQPTAGARS